MARPRSIYPYNFRLEQVRFDGPVLVPKSYPLESILTWSLLAGSSLLTGFTAHVGAEVHKPVRLKIHPHAPGPAAMGG